MSTTAPTRRVITFQITKTGWYAIKITARCPNSQSDLRVEIDGLSFREIPPDRNKQLFNHPAAWNGAASRGQSQTNIFLIQLRAGAHRLDFFARGQVTDFRSEILPIKNIDHIVFNLHLAAADYDRQPFVNFILVDLPLASISGTATVQWRRDTSNVRGDGDDLKLLVDGRNYTTDEIYGWLWHADKNQWPQARTSRQSVCPTLPTGLHYVEFWADRSPTIEQIVLDTVPFFKGDYWLNPCVKMITTGQQTVSKAVLGVYLPSGQPQELAQSQLKLYYKGQNLLAPPPAGREITPALSALAQNLDDTLETKFDFSQPLKQEGLWYYYGIDTLWRLYQEKMGDQDLFDARLWQLTKTT